ncbi:MAG: DNA polymerase III subunit chi [Hydrogenovibrio sp.]|uniref:DNA polymerase III subunit chi n=1 Tax=Hydrogenovibrio sp. TaxID=2065821 RepID=UPI0028700596|nr:DNA polymerase III subunit chi [Hydrogenovibrio sp.]MDR9498471.1 DNA polymerase III subunit chi [Hydrogenovibrio sp.]
MSAAQRPENQDVLFYILPGQDPAELDRFVLKLIHKIHRQSRRADLLVADQATALKLETDIWGMQPQSFVPCSVNAEMPAPFQIHTAFPQTPGNDVLINLNPELDPEQAITTARYHRLIEVLDQTPERIELGRKRWRQYKQLGLTPTSHKL